ncbi:MAG TPA: hypothetical protein VJG90_08045 [Candidatus Nanoarchaeia archaeon]|nr:hypothetical protein [Candidatus Nanoarchaeia archaeon]
MAQNKKGNGNGPTVAEVKPKPRKDVKPEELHYTSAQYPIRELYNALLSRQAALVHAGYECNWHSMEIASGKELLVPHHVQKNDEKTIRCWPLLVSDKKFGGASNLQLGLEIDILENVAVLKGTGRIPRDENRYEMVHELLSQFKGLTGIQLTVEARG